MLYKETLKMPPIFQSSYIGRPSSVQRTCNQL